MLSKNMLTGSLRIIVLLVALAGVLLVLKRSDVPQQAQDTQRYLLVEVKPLPPPWRDLVGLRCEPALVSATELRTLTCFLKNNSLKFIVAGSLDISVVLEGANNQQGGLLSFDTFLHPDFRAEHPRNLVAPGAEYRLEDLPSTFTNLITNITAAIDHVEFDDGTTIGPDRGGSQVVRAQREGARKYKAWLVKKYEKTHSINGVISLLTQDDLSSELVLGDPNEEQGARIFRKQERQLYETKGAAAIQKHMETGKTPR